jgi:hypothetical protein
LIVSLLACLIFSGKFVIHLRYIVATSLKIATGDVDFHFSLSATTAQATFMCHKANFGWFRHYSYIALSKHAAT